MLNSLKNNIRDISNDTKLNTYDSISTARVIKINEISNLCDINMSLPTTGQVSTFKNIPVEVDCSGVIGWFPEVNEIVMVQTSHNLYKIIGPYVPHNNASSKRHYNDTKYNSLTSFYNYTIAGNII